MHRVSGHRESGSRSRRPLLILVPFVVLAVVGVVLGRSAFGPSDAEAAAATFGITSDAPDTDATDAPTEPAAPTTTAAPKAAPVKVRNLGVRRGVLTLRGPASAAKGTRVTFVLTGPKRVTRTDTTAPFGVKIDTRKMPNGRYAVTVRTVAAGESTVVARSTLRVDNPKAKPKPTPTTAKPKPKPTSTRPSNGGGSTNPPASGFAGQVLALVNEEREDADCKPLRLDSTLNKVAQAHSQDMATQNYFDHTSKDGRSPFERMTDAGYQFSTAAENIAAGSTTAAGVMDQWMNSAGHKANILNCAFTELGVGLAKTSSADYPTYWTQNFGTPR